jgi:putative Mn2+ efflux pump MntP
MGTRLGTRFAHRAEALGGVVLIAIGARILYEHLS